jgi:hypothetical protein
MTILTMLVISVVAMILLRVAIFVLVRGLACGIPENRDRHLEMDLKSLTFKFSDVRNDQHDAARREPFSHAPHQTSHDDVVEIKEFEGRQLRRAGRTTADHRESDQ